MLQKVLLLQCIYMCRFREDGRDISLPHFLGRGAGMIIILSFSVTFFFTESTFSREISNLTYLASTTLNKYFFFSVIYKIWRKRFNFLKFDYITMIALLTFVTNTIEDNRQAHKPLQLSTLVS